MSADGTWDLIVDSPSGRQRVRVDLRTEGNQLVGNVTNRTNKRVADVVEGAVHGTSLAWGSTSVTTGAKLAFTTRIDGDTMTGNVETGLFGRFGVSGRRESRASAPCDSLALLVSGWCDG